MNCKLHVTKPIHVFSCTIRPYHLTFSAIIYFVSGEQILAFACMHTHIQTQTLLIITKLVKLEQSPYIQMHI